MKKILLGFITIGLLTVVGCENSINNNNKQELIEENFVKIDSAIIRVESFRRMKQIRLYAKMKILTDISNLSYVNLNVTYKDKYDKVWLNEKLQIKDIDCKLNGWCEQVFIIDWYQNLHGGLPIDEVFMNLSQFKDYYRLKYYKGELVKLKGGSLSEGFNKILVPDAQVKATGFK